jgi:Spy/CpxP family protein refolding chaperone
MKSMEFVFVLALAASAALAQPTNQPMRHGDQAPMGGPMAMMQKLNLTDDQQVQIRKMHVDFQKKQIQNQAKIRLARLDLGQMMQADKPDRAAIEKAIRDIASVETETKLARVDQMLAIRGVLTPEQQKTMKQNMMYRRGAMRRHMGMFRQGGPGFLGENLTSPPDTDLLDMAAMPDQMDPPEVSVDELDLGEIIEE